MNAPASTEIPPIRNQVIRTCFNVRPVFYLCVLFSTLSLFSCGSNHTTLPRLTPDAVVLAFGDSLTFGTGAGPSDSYPEILSSLIHRRVINAGIPGEISADGLRRLPNVLDAVKPKLMILCHGGNDMLRHLDARHMKKNLRDMIRQAKQRGIAVVLIGVPKPALLYLESVKIYRELAQELDIPLEENILSTIIKNGALKSDAVHPNATGYRQLAEAVAALLQRQGAL